MLRNCERYKLATSKKRRGGRSPTAAIEFVFSLPKTIRPNNKQWRSILNIVMRNLASSLDIKSNELASITRAVVHRQNQDTELKGSGDHMHILLGKFTDDLVYLRNLQRKSTTRLIKQSFNVAMLNVTGISNETYKPIKSYAGNAKKRAPSWKVKAARKSEKVSEQQKRLKCIIEQARKWLEAFESQDARQMNRQFNRINRELERLGDIQVDKQDEAMSKLVSSLLKDIDSKQKNLRKSREVKNKFALVMK